MDCCRVMVWQEKAGMGASGSFASDPEDGHDFRFFRLRLGDGLLETSFRMGGSIVYIPNFDGKHCEDDTIKRPLMRVESSSKFVRICDQRKNEARLQCYDGIRVCIYFAVVPRMKSEILVRDDFLSNFLGKPISTAKLGIRKWRQV